MAGSAAQKTGLIFPTTVGTMPTQSALFGMFRRGLDIPVTQKTSVCSFTRWPLLRAARPVAERRYLRSQPAFPRVPPRPKGAVWSQGALPLARAAVSPQPICMSLYAPARQRRAVRKGTQSPSSTSTKKGWPQCSHTGLSSKSMSEARIITVWPQLGQSKESS